MSVTAVLRPLDSAPCHKPTGPFRNNRDRELVQRAIYYRAGPAATAAVGDLRTTINNKIIVIIIIVTVYDNAAARMIIIITI